MSLLQRQNSLIGFSQQHQFYTNQLLTLFYYVLITTFHLNIEYEKNNIIVVIFVIFHQLKLNH